MLKKQPSDNTEKNNQVPMQIRTAKIVLTLLTVILFVLALLYVFYLFNNNNKDNNIDSNYDPTLARSYDESINIAKNISNEIKNYYDNKDYDTIEKKYIEEINKYNNNNLVKTILYYDLARYMYYGEEYDKAYNYAKKSTENDSQSLYEEPILVILSSSAERTDKLEEALAYYERLLEILAGKDYIEAGTTEEVETSIQRIKERIRS